jgi:hypothetical protein
MRTSTKPTKPSVAPHRRVIEMDGMLGKMYHATKRKGFFLHNIPKFPVRCSRLKVSTEMTIKLDYPILRYAIVGHNGPWFRAL